MHLVALINDTTGALIASAYNDPDTIMALILGLGCNIAYMENTGSIPKLQDHDQAKDLPPETAMAINCECGAFDNSHIVLPCTKYDKSVDDESPRPGEQTFEKMSAGLYLGEIFRLILFDLHSRNLILAEHRALSYLQTPFCIDADTLCTIESDESPELANTKNLLNKQYHLNASPSDLQAIQRLAIMVSVRASRLAAAGVAAICQKKNISKGHVAGDAPIAIKYPQFKQRWAQALGEILDWPEDRKEDPITLTLAEDGSGVGAAVIAAMAIERARKGEMVGIRTGNFVKQGGH